MVLKRTDTDDQSEGGGIAMAVETLRSPQVPPMPKPKSEEDKMSVFWRVFGGTILSILALAALTLYNNLTSNIAELRAEVGRLNESKAEWAKKDDLQTLRTQAATQAGYRTEIDSLKERATKYRVELDDSRKEARTANDALRKEVGSVESLKEKLAAMTLDMKVCLDDGARLRQELSKNQAEDNTRRDLRDTQMKKLDETIKELQKTLTEAREKIARLEGQQAPMKTAGAAGAAKD